jgi:multidrug efflux pump subunit AcrA (membrane-fusion protein)
MKYLKLFGFLLLLSAIVFTSFSCTAAPTTATPTTRTAVVTKGSLTNAITATGNLVYSTTEDLAFEIPGYVEEVLVSEGDTVKKDQELVKLNTSDWEDQITALTKTLSNAQRNFTAKQRALAAAQNTLSAKQISLAAVQRAVTGKELALKQAQIDIDSANYTLNNLADVKTAQDSVDAAQLALDIAIANKEGSTLIDLRNKELADAIKVRDSVLATTNTRLTTSAALAIAQAKLTVLQKQNSLDAARQAVIDANTAIANAQIDVQNAQLDIKDAQLNVDDAQQAITDAQANLDDKKSLSPTIMAPFDGYITALKVKGGDEIQKGTVAMTIADPSQFEASVLVTENDINTVKLDGTATISLDALSDLSFPAKITWIAPTATITSGVVNYKVTVTLTSLKPISARQAARGSSSITGQTGTLPSGAGPQSGFNRPTGTATPGATPAVGFSRPSGTTGTDASANTTQNITLKQGLSATVSIISQQKDDVLYIPSRAITRLGSNQSVKVINGTAVETRTVTTGMTDGTNTEILTGLTEGETVTYTTTTTTSTNTNRNFGGGFQGPVRIGG